MRPSQSGCLRRLSGGRLSRLINCLFLRRGCRARRAVYRSAVIRLLSLCTAVSVRCGGSEVLQPPNAEKRLIRSWARYHIETEVWIPCQVEVDTSRRKPRWAHVTTVDVTDGLVEGTAVALYFKQRDGVVLMAYGKVVRRLKDGTLRIKVPWFVSATLAERGGVNVGEITGKILIHDCAVQYHVVEEEAEEEKESGRCIRIKPVIDKE